MVIQLSNTIDFGELYAAGTSANSVLVQRNLYDPCVETVVYTDFPPEGRIGVPTADELADNGVRSVTRAPQGTDGITYLADNIVHGICTPLTDAYRAEVLRRTVANSLAEALTKAKEAVEHAPERARHE